MSRLNIQPIKLDDLSNLSFDFDTNFCLENLEKIETDPNKFVVSKSYTDLKPGYIVRAGNMKSILAYAYCSTFFIFFSKQHLNMFNSRKLIDDAGAFVHYNTNTPEHVSYLQLSSYFDSWPKYGLSEMEKYDITSVYPTNIDLNMFKTKQDIIDFYNKNKLYNI